MTADVILERSPAKINWNLRVLGRRQDGFHEIESLITPISLYDELVFEPAAAGRFELICDHPEVPTDRRNLVLMAASTLAEETGAESGFVCRLTKRIPLGGGLGGGSSNAAAALRALSRLWSLDLSRERLLSVAARIGSDVSLFLFDQTVLVSGRGEKVRPLPLDWHGWIVLLLPGIAVSTAAVYQAWRPEDSGHEIQAVASSSEAPPAVRAVSWMDQTFNMLEPPAMALYPALRELADRAEKLAGRRVRMSGSGSSFFTAFDDEAEARQFADSASNATEVETLVVQPLEQAPMEGKRGGFVAQKQ